MESEELPLSDEQMRLENEIMKLQLQAEYGTVFPDAKTIGADPEPEYAFLKRVLLLHRRIARTPPRPLREVLDFEQFAPAASFGDAQALHNALWDALDYLEAAHVIVEFDCDYPDLLMYEFITRELPELEVIGTPTRDDYICVLYEAFHPNARADVEALAFDFFEALFSGDILRHTALYFQADALPNGATGAAALQAVIERFLGCFDAVADWQMHVHGVDLEPDAETGDSARVHGDIEYTIRLSDGSGQTISGPFRLCLLRASRLWYISDFRLHGFIWPPGD